ncbi:pentapeptide repeat-containing protein [Paractinoplanes maris]|uniref:pentapeptide repeat-containing protein n=1 Tax=Paractinoplanes maris TaxID=1734446 RepID=UPI003F68FC0F
MGGDQGLENLADLSALPGRVEARETSPHATAGGSAGQAEAAGRDLGRGHRLSGLRVGNLCRCGRRRINLRRINLRRINLRQIDLRRVDLLGGRLSSCTSR